MRHEISSRDVVSSYPMKLTVSAAVGFSLGQDTWFPHSDRYNVVDGLEIRLVSAMVLCGVEIANTFSTEDADPGGETASISPPLISYLIHFAPVTGSDKRTTYHEFNWLLH